MIKIRNSIIRAITEPKLKKSVLMNHIDDRREFKDFFEWHYDLHVDATRTSDEEIKKIIKLLENYTDVLGTKTVIRDLKNWLDLKHDKLRTVKRVRDFDSILIQYLKDVKGHRIYTHDSYGADAMLPFRVTEIRYHPKETHNYSTTPEHVTMDIVYKRFGMEVERQIVFWSNDILFKTPLDALIDKGFQPETDELRKQYLSDLEKYETIKDLIGTQYIADGFGRSDTLDTDEGRRRTSGYRRNGNTFKFINHKVLIDIFVENEARYEELRDKSHVDDGRAFWARIDGQYKKSETRSFESEDIDELELGDIEKDVEIPIHPHVVVFDLIRHLRLTTHVQFISEYIYDETLAEKLVIDSKVKGLIQTLVNNELKFDDIIKNKSGGKVMLLAGGAGVGKTLTAEVFAEYQHKALYNVQASQLGLNPEELETELKLVLTRASRWNAILLIDEADVYVHKRENNLVQNAIVGVFLRVLEYHDATIFLTTNLPDIVDDAIISRCIAKIDYEYPSESEQKQIWNIISKNSKIPITEELINQIVEKYPNYSGRDIKNILKLSNLKSKADRKPIDMEMIDFTAKFNPSIMKKGDDCN